MQFKLYSNGVSYDLQSLRTLHKIIGLVIPWPVGCQLRKKFRIYLHCS